jgi:hypothetical protein
VQPLPGPDGSGPDLPTCGHPGSTVP